VPTTSRRICSTAAFSSVVSAIIIQLVDN
jgi:hypothetical protein